MTARRLVPAVACLATVLATPAVAAPRKVCNLLKGSGSFSHDRGVPYEGPLNIRSADLASNATALTAVIRVIDVDPPTSAATGRFFAFFFSRHEEENYIVDGSFWPGGARFALGQASEPFDPKANEVAAPEVTWLGPAKAVVDTTRNEVRLSVPMSLFKKASSGSMRNGATVTYLGAMTGTMYGTDRSATPVPEPVPTAVGLGGDFEYGSDRIRYRLGARSCVAVGR